MPGDEGKHPLPAHHYYTPHIPQTRGQTQVREPEQIGEFPVFNKRVNDIVLRIQSLLTAKADNAKLPVSKADRSAVCANLKEEIEYRSKMLSHIIKTEGGPWENAGQSKEKEKTK